MDEKLRQAVNKAKYSPDPKCRMCLGTGVRLIKVDPDSCIYWANIGQMPCICLYLGDMDDELRSFIAQGISNTAKELKKEMEENPDKVMQDMLLRDLLSGGKIDEGSN